MLNNTQKAVLNHIVNNAIELIEELAQENSLNEEASIGVAKFLLADNENFTKMSQKQLHHFEKVIKPLIENVLCDGVIGIHEDGSSSCIGNEFIDEETLLQAYETDDMRCQLCIADAEAFHNED